MSTTDRETDDAELRALLCAAAADLEVPERPGLATDSAAVDSAALGEPTTSIAPGGRGAPRRAVLGMAATVAAFVIAGGALWAIAADSDGHRVETGPAQEGQGPVDTTRQGPPATTTAPDAPNGVPTDRWYREEGIWRLPEMSSGYRVTSAMTVPATRPPFLVALDVGGDTQRFVAISMLHAGNLEAAPLERQERVGRTVVRQYGPGDDPGVTWFEVVSTYNEQDGFLIASKRVDPQEVWAYTSDLATITFPDAGNHATTIAAALVDAIQAVTLPSGFAPAWGAADPSAVLDGRAEGTSLHLGVSAPDGRSYGLTLTPAVVGTPAATRLASELTGAPFSRTTGAGLPPELVAGDDMVVFTGDGTRISVGSTNTPTGQTSGDDLAAVLGSLRSLDETAARVELANRGIALGQMTPDTATTTTSAP